MSRRSNLEIHSVKLSKQIKTHLRHKGAKCASPLNPPNTDTIILPSADQRYNQNLPTVSALRLLHQKIYCLTNLML
jgi:hypothetical protein